MVIDSGPDPDRPWTLDPPEKWIHKVKLAFVCMACEETYFLVIENKDWVESPSRMMGPVATRCECGAVMGVVTLQVQELQV